MSIWITLASLRLTDDERCLLLNHMRKCRVGKIVELRCDQLVRGAIWSRCKEMFKLFAQGREVTRAGFRDTAYYSYLRAMDPRRAFAEKDVWVFYKFFHRYRRGKASIFPPCVFVHEDRVTRLRGKHRVAILRHFGIETVACVAVTVQDIEKWRELRVELACSRKLPRTRRMQRVC